MIAGKSGVARYSVYHTPAKGWHHVKDRDFGEWVKFKDHESLLLDARADAASWETQCDDARKEWHACLLRAERAEALAGERLEIIKRTRQIITGSMDAKYLAMDATGEVGLVQYLDAAIDAMAGEQSAWRDYVDEFVGAAALKALRQRFDALAEGGREVG